ncbi:Uncharacterised protein [Segatella copri]|nr:Uncharacterised protein [Segatella copri]
MSQFYFFINRNHRGSTYLYKIFVEGFTITIGYTLLYLKLSHYLSS